MKLIIVKIIIVKIIIGKIIVKIIITKIIITKTIIVKIIIGEVREEYLYYWVCDTWGGRTIDGASTDGWFASIDSIQGITYVRKAENLKSMSARIILCCWFYLDYKIWIQILLSEVGGNFHPC